MKSFLAVFNAFPSILAAVQAVEAAIPVPSAGKQKLDLILGAAGTAWAITQAEQQLSKNTTLNAVEALVNLSVAGLNAAGAFKTTAPVSSN
ncbi:MAG: hypothetical protein QOJ99_1024 [Bryobacterales bacterium]|jgi:hypothetical protein|nr:hypothetical protein [Bryobacterales bacterium]